MYRTSNFNCRDREGKSVRAVVRKQQDILELQRKSPAITSALTQGQLEIALVPDLLSNDAVFNVLSGVTVVIHLVSPLARKVITFHAFPTPLLYVLTGGKEQ